jgi:transposase
MKKIRIQNTIIVKEAFMKTYKTTKEFVKGKEVFCGMDVHLKHWNLCFFCDGEEIEKHRLHPEYPILKTLLYMRYASAKTVHLVYEAGFSGFWLYRKLRKDGYDCIVTPTTRIPKSTDRVKTDRRDAEKLARYLAAGMLKAVTVPPMDVEADRRLNRRRKQTVKRKTRTQNQIKAFLHLHGLSKPETIKSSWSKSFMRWLSELWFEHESDTFLLNRMIRTYDHVRDELAELTRYLRVLSRSLKYKDNYKRITALRGVGLITAMTFLLELFSISRFKNTSCFSSFLGLTPSQHSSGEHVRLGHITREGNSHLRGVLVESAWTVIKHDPHLRDKYLRIRARGTNGNKAIVAVARSLAIRLRRCLLDEVEYAISIC